MPNAIVTIIVLLLISLAPLGLACVLKSQATTKIIWTGVCFMFGFSALWLSGALEYLAKTAECGHEPVIARGFMYTSYYELPSETTYALSIFGGGGFYCTAAEAEGAGSEPAYTAS